MENITIYRNESAIATVNIDEQTIMVKKLLNTNRLTVVFVTDKTLPIAIGDYVTVEGEKMVLNHLPTIDKQNANTKKYTAVFYGPLYNFNHKLLISSDGLVDFSFTGTAEDMLNLIINSINTLDSGWSLGDVDDSEVKTIQFNEDTCRTALTKIKDAFNFEFNRTGKAINLKEAVGEVKNHTFKYGQGNGLYNLIRKGVSNNSLVTRLYAFGGTNNIDYTYRNRAKRLIFEEKYLDKNTDIYGVREGYFSDENIFPQRTSTLTDASIVLNEGVLDEEASYLEDTTIDFNINDYLMEGLTAKIVFKSGDLEGYEFEIWKYDHNTKRIYINPYSESDGFTLPSETLTIATGDTYTLVNIKMPEIYIIEAEAKLKSEAQKFIDANCVPKCVYIVKIDPKYAKTNSIDITSGDLIKIIDTDMGIDSSIRINQLSYPIVNPYKMTAIIADFIPYTLQEKVAENAIFFNSKVSKAISQQTSNTTNNIVNNTTINEGNLNKIEINGRLFFWEKGFDNTGDELEIGDVIFDNYWTRYHFVKKWMYKGGIRELRASWDELETLDFTPEES